MFAAITKAKGGTIHLANKPDLRAELAIWLNLATKSQEGPWNKERHFDVQTTPLNSDASSNQWGGVVGLPEGPFEAGGGFPDGWLPKHINLKEMFALLELLKECCRVHPGVLRRAQLVAGVDSTAVVGSFNKGRARNPVAHKMLIDLFDLQVSQGFWLSLQWVPTADNHAPDAITRPSRDENLQLRPARFEELQAFFGEFTVDLIASSENAHRGAADAAGHRRRLPFFSRYHCEGSAGVGVLSQNVAITPGTNDVAFAFVFPPPVMVGVVVQHLADCKAHAVVILPDVHGYWFPRVRCATVREYALPQRGSFGYPHHQDGVREFVFAKHRMRAVELDFRGF